MEAITLFIKEILPILVGIFLVVFVSILLTRLILLFLIQRAYDRYQIFKKAVKKKINRKSKIDKEDEELMRAKDELLKSHSATKAAAKAKSGENRSYELMSSMSQEEERKEVEEVKIVDLVKPVGFWTSMILGQKLTYLVSAAQIINKRSKQGFWVSMIEAKERAAGRERGRGL